MDLKTDKVVQTNWEETLGASDLLDLNLPKEFMDIVQAYYEKGHNAGESAAIDSMREIYENDVDLFEEFFEIDDGDVC